MSFIQLVQLIEEIYALIQKTKTNGVYDKILAAEQAIEGELKNEPLVKEIEEKIMSIFIKK